MRHFAEPRASTILFAVVLFVFATSSLAAAATELSYGPGGVTLAAGQSISAGPITLRMKSDCVLALTNASNQTLWRSGPRETDCSSPKAAFEQDGSLAVSSIVNGQRSILWSSHTSGSNKLVLLQKAPFLTIMNLDGSPAWKAVDSLTLESIDPALMATIGARGGLYSRHIQTRPALPVASGDRVVNFQAADGNEVQVVVKAPGPKSREVYQVPPYPMAPKQRVLDYLSGAIAYATGSNPLGTVYGTVIFPKAVYEVEDFRGCDSARGANGYNNWEIANITDLVIDGQGSTLNFNGLCEGIEMDWVQRVAFKNFTIDWPKVELAGLGTVQNVDETAGTMELLIDPTTPSTKAQRLRPSRPGTRSTIIGPLRILPRTRAFP